MPYTLPVSYDKFLENISLTGDHTKTAADRAKAILELLGKNFSVLEVIPMGSVVRGTAVKGIADVDVMAVLHYSRHIKDKAARAVLENVREQLSEYNAKMAKRNGQSVTLYFTSWPNVDIVPAARFEDSGLVTHYEIPDANSNDWIRTHPQKHGAAVGTRSPLSRQRIQMIKAWNGAHSEILQSFHLEVMELLTNEAATDRPWSMFEYFDRAVQLIGVPLSHPNDASNRVDGYLTGGDRIEAKRRLESARDDLRSAWWLNLPQQNRTQEAIEICRRVFGNKFPAYR